MTTITELLLSCVSWDTDISDGISLQEQEVVLLNLDLKNSGSAGKQMSASESMGRPPASEDLIGAPVGGA